MSTSDHFGAWDQVSSELRISTTKKSVNCMANEQNFYSTNFCQSLFTENVVILVCVAQYV